MPIVKKGLREIEVWVPYDFKPEMRTIIDVIMSLLMIIYSDLYDQLMTRCVVILTFHL